MAITPLLRDQSSLICFHAASRQRLQPPGSASMSSKLWIRLTSPCSVASPSSSLSRSSCPSSSATSSSAAPPPCRPRPCFAAPASPRRADRQQATSWAPIAKASAQPLLRLDHDQAGPHRPSPSPFRSFPFALPPISRNSLSFISFCSYRRPPWPPFFLVAALRIPAGSPFLHEPFLAGVLRRCDSLELSRDVPCFAIAYRNLCFLYNE
ncbi:uncharacterized protein LOC119317203 isoform X1 [Triticum dicoccoides]|uniref:uncharacterized protein LOC119317203 isoform X1 n=1 Tax=Triticum dicoccoides TaxID=85692 RepID=UPI001890EE19|nr:uncharacterized protein LOC119317203 isoform X1 [Triticum dicoccoides]XP_037447526.1 uncharacterized protein LOC119317203 isoform X1 [Triticum dicoccoides]